MCVDNGSSFFGRTLRPRMAVVSFLRNAMAYLRYAPDCDWHVFEEAVAGEGESRLAVWHKDHEAQGASYTMSMIQKMLELEDYSASPGMNRTINACSVMRSKPGWTNSQVRRSSRMLKASLFLPPDPSASRRAFPVRRSRRAQRLNVLTRTTCLGGQHATPTPRAPPNSRGDTGPWTTPWFLVRSGYWCCTRILSSDLGVSCGRPPLRTPPNASVRADSAESSLEFFPSA